MLQYFILWVTDLPFLTWDLWDRTLYSYFHQTPVKPRPLIYGELYQIHFIWHCCPAICSLWWLLTWRMNPPNALNKNDWINIYSNFSDEHLSLYYPKSALHFRHDWGVFSSDVVWIQQLFPVLWTGLDFREHFIVLISSKYTVILHERDYSQS